MKKPLSRLLAASLFVIIGITVLSVIRREKTKFLLDNQTPTKGALSPLAHKNSKEKGVGMGTAGNIVTNILDETIENAHLLCENELIPLSRDKPNPYWIKQAITYGARGKVTLHIIDSTSKDVTSADIRGGFYNNGLPGYDFKGKSDSSGLMTLENDCTGDLNFAVEKNGYYRTDLRYWFFKSGFDCVKGGRWIPWNPTIKVTLKEKRNPIPLFTRIIDKTLPKGEDVGFDCLAADYVAPWGGGKYADFVLRYESITPHNPVTLRDWSYITNSLVVSASSGGGFLMKQKDIFSQLVSEHEAPEDGYVSHVAYELKRTAEQIFVNTQLDDGEYLFFRSARRGQQSECYGKIYRLTYRENPHMVNVATIKMAYYFNPTPKDRNLEFDGKNNLFNPDWRDYKWPREP